LPGQLTREGHVSDRSIGSPDLANRGAIDEDGLRLFDEPRPARQHATMLSGRSRSVNDNLSIDASTSALLVIAKLCVQVLS
jgi:hypothetical protein